MLTSEFDYDLPPELIAQTPVEPRDASRLLVLDRSKDAPEHRCFRDILDYLRPGDLLVANETRVIPARLYATKVPSGGRVELLLLARRGPRTWETLVKGRKVSAAQKLRLGNGSGGRPLEAIVEGHTEGGGRLVTFDEPIEAHWQRLGVVPLPPYIHERLAQAERYQTVYARIEGSAAAPTAGLHFTPELIQQTLERNVEWATVLLHIGLDTFRPVSEERVQDHAMHSEYCSLTSEAAQRINNAKRHGRRVIAVGTTSVRVLETAAQGSASGVQPWDGPSHLFIYPGYNFRVVDALITNFHLPRSSLLMLVSAFAGLDSIRRAYAEAVHLRYRFYSFGDAMLLL
jgi:S-adenosylmethionine:tRNA ribosyltransferase-isomerase